MMMVANQILETIVGTVCAIDESNQTVTVKLDRWPEELGKECENRAAIVLVTKTEAVAGYEAEQE